MRIPAPLSLAVLLALVACGDDPVAPGGSPGISFPVGANVSDTIDATPVQALRVQVRGADGRPARNEVVRVEGVPDNVGSYEMLVGRLGGGYYQPLLADTTDEDGVIHVQVRMGPTTGLARLLVTAPALGLQDTARFDILPGAAAEIQLMTTGSTIPVGGTLALDARVADRRGNPRSDAVQYASSNSAASVSGNVVTALAFGNATISVNAGNLSAVVVVGIVPVGSIAFNVRPAHTGQISTIYTANLDGSELVQRATTAAGVGYFGTMTPAWLSSTQLLYTDEGSGGRPLYRLNMESGQSTRFLPPAEQMEIEQHPRVSRDGKWVVFSGGTYQGYWLYRVRVTGEDFQRLSPQNLPLSHWMPAPSPDASQIAYGVQGAEEGGFEVMDLNGGGVRHIAVHGELPSWSPDGREIAYLSEHAQLRIVNADGTGDRPLASESHRFGGGIDWSPDGAYIVAAADAWQLAIVEVATGEVVTVAIPGIEGYLGFPVWRPDAP